MGEVEVIIMDITISDSIVHLSKLLCLSDSVCSHYVLKEVGT